MALTSIKFAPGIDKQDTAVGAIGRWVDCDNARFRYGLPEKMGGWSSLLTDTICGVARKQHSFVDLDGNRYVGIGTDKFLLVYFEGTLYDITPWRSNNAGVQTTFTSSTLSTDSTVVKTCTITTTSAHSLSVGDMIVLDSVTLPALTGLSASDFEDKLFQVLTVPTDVTFTIDSLNQASAVVATGGSMTVQPYQSVGPAAQTYGYGFGVGNYGGTITGVLTNDLDGALNADTAGTGGVGTSITLTSATGFPSSGTIAVENELITYTGVSTNDLTGCTRGAYGTATAGTSNGQAHGDGTTVSNATDYTGWGDAVDASTITLEPGLWSLSNWGGVLVATISNGKTFTWDSTIAARFTTRASTTTTSYVTALTGDDGKSYRKSNDFNFSNDSTLNSFRNRNNHWYASSQDDMFLRFSDQEEINTYAPSATNSAGTYRLQDGSKIMGGIVAKENILIWTDNALYSMKFVGAPYTFGFEQVGTNCGLIGQNAVVEIDGVAYWVGNNGFFSFDGTVNNLPCSVEDYVFDDFDTTKGQQVNAGINNLFTEVIWYYPTQGATYNDRYVIHNYGESQELPMGNWYIGSNTNSIRTTWIDSIIYPKPYATQFKSDATGTFSKYYWRNRIRQSVYFQHETGTDQINPDGTTTTLTSHVQSYNFSLQKDQTEVFLAMRRFIPNFKLLTTKNTVTIKLKDYPADTLANSDFSPFSVYPTTQKIDTRASGRYASLRIENDGAGENWRFGTFQVDLTTG
jgi:hypothetical protein